MQHNKFKAMKFRFLILLTLFTLSSAFAQLKTIIGDTDYPFWIHIPETEKTEKQPVLIFLHGKSLSGTNINRVKRYGVLRAMEKGRKIPAIVVAPQLASGSWNPDKVLQLLEYVQKNYNTDLSRVYVCGMSLGSYGTLHFAGKYADKITAAVAICGGGNVNDASRLATLPLWIQHGNKDYIVRMSESKKVVDAIKKHKPDADVTFTVIPGGNHSNVERLFHENALYDWLFKQVKTITKTNL
ncbi:phospholipase/Carboxylesterase [Flavobacterium cauense R2A-7]|uniref:Dienelactone hydrolase family protein n=2 Tax=Flavobacterium TaxID=237 RepID=V6RYT3_9FLAO|nr:phospholipase/Carboxylesterase [Flavobacterium cauense R2A-7]TWI14485.1 dienelactone hydrolase family protein [Flavobacterium cauense R2A-7]